MEDFGWFAQYTWCSVMIYLVLESMGDVAVHFILCKTEFKKVSIASTTFAMICLVIWCIVLLVNTYESIDSILKCLYIFDFKIISIKSFHIVWFDSMISLIIIASCFSHGYCNLFCELSALCLLMHWLLTKPGHQQPCHWLWCRQNVAFLHSNIHQIMHNVKSYGSGHETAAVLLPGFAINSKTR